jgi:hypothetical protein
MQAVSDAFLLNMAEVSAGLIGLFLVGIFFLDTAWNAVLFAILSVALIAANLDTAGQVREVQKVTGSNTLLLNQVAGTVGVVLLVTLPWILGGIDPTREDFTWAILIAFATAFLSVATAVLSVFDVARSTPT